MRIPWVIPAAIAALLVPATIASIGAMQVRQPQPVPPSSGRAVTCLVGPGENQLFVAGNSPVTARSLAGEQVGEDKQLAMKLQDPLALNSRDRFAAGVLTTSGLTRAWAGCPASRTTGVLQLANPKSSDLLLVNPDDVPASVDLKIYGFKGEADVLGARGIALSAKSSRVVPLSELVPDDAPVGISIQTPTGRVAAIGRSWSAAGATFNSVMSPAKSLYFPGLFTTSAKTQVLLTNPNAERISVSVSALGTQQIALADAQNINLEPGTTLMLDVTAALAGEASGLVVTADQPVAASVLSTVGQDHALVAGAEPLLVGRVLAPTGGSLAVTNTSERQVTVTIEQTPETGMRPPVIELVLPPLSTKRVDVAGTGRVQLDLLATSPVVAALSSHGANGAVVVPVESMTVIGRGEVTMNYDPVVR